MRTIAAWIGAEPCAHRMTCRRRRPIQTPVLRRIGSKSAVSALLSLSGAEFDRGRRARDSPARFAAIEAHPISSHARRSDGRSPFGLAVDGREESPGSTEARCRVTPGGGDPRESATETYRQARSSLGSPHGTAWAARVKWCGKSAPRRRQRRRQGKPHREQDQVGAAGGAGLRSGAAGRACRAAARVGRVRRSVTNVPDEWPSPPPLRGGTEPGLQAVWHLNLKQLFFRFLVEFLPDLPGLKPSPPATGLYTCATRVKGRAGCSRRASDAVFAALPECYRELRNVTKLRKAQNENE